MSTATERRGNNEAVLRLCELAASRDRPAYEYTLLLARAARVCDDLVDADVIVSPPAIVHMVSALLVEIPQNTFYQKHSSHLSALHAVAWNGWLDANSLEGGDPTDKIYAHVLRDLINEVLPQVALLTGGYEHMRKVSVMMRQLFKKEID